MRSFSDTLGQVFRAIMANKLRSFLTMFGIAWGVFSLLVLVGLGEGFREGQHKQLAQFGNDVVMVLNGTIPALANQHTGMRPYELTLRDEADIRSLPEVRGVTAELARSDLYEVSQWGNTSAHLSGCQPNYTIVRWLPIAVGRFLDDQDIRESRRVALIASKSAALLFPGRPVLGETIIINDVAFTVIGTGKPIGRGNNTWDDEKIFIPITTMLELFPLKGDNIPQMRSLRSSTTPPSKTTIPPPVSPCIASLAGNHGFDPSLKDAFNELDTITEEKMIGAIFNAMDVFLGGVGIVTLGLGAVGIINIMLVSVIGANPRDRRAEGHRRHQAQHSRAVLLGGPLAHRHQRPHRHPGFRGDSCALLQALLTDKMPGFDPPRLVPWSAALALGSLMLCGVAAGLYPASKAAQWTPSKRCGGSNRRARR